MKAKIPSLFVATIISLLTSLTAQAADALLDQIPKVFERAESQYSEMLGTLGSDPNFPRTAKPDGSVVTVKSEDWTSGFFPGNLWFLYEYTGSQQWKEKALIYTLKLEGLRNFKDHHDVGFMLGCSYGNALRLSPQDEYRQVLLDGAAALATRFVPKIGLIRSWDYKPYTCPVIIDNMMNLELLTWAAKNGGDPKLGEIAISHADQTNKNHFRPDGSAYHVADYDPETGWLRGYHANQGADVRTPWARGQGWAIYGFSMMYRQTKKPEYLARAKAVADLVIAHPNMPTDKVPYWDFGVEASDATPRDASAAAVIASGLLELSQQVEDGTKYLQFAQAQLLSLSSASYLSAPGTNGGFLLAHSIGHLPANSEINVPLVYADYYFLEALLRYKAIGTGKPRLEFGSVR